MPLLPLVLQARQKNEIVREYSNAVARCLTGFMSGLRIMGFTSPVETCMGCGAKSSRVISV